MSEDGGILVLARHGEAVSRAVDPARPAVRFSPGSIAVLEREGEAWRVTAAGEP